MDNNYDKDLYEKVLYDVMGDYYDQYDNNDHSFYELAHDLDNEYDSDSDNEENVEIDINDPDSDNEENVEINEPNYPNLDSDYYSELDCDADNYYIPLDPSNGHYLTYSDPNNRNYDSDDFISDPDSEAEPDEGIQEDLNDNE